MRFDLYAKSIVDSQVVMKELFMPATENQPLTVQRRTRQKSPRSYSYTKQKQRKEPTEQPHIKNSLQVI